MESTIDDPLVAAAERLDLAEVRRLLESGSRRATDRDLEGRSALDVLAEHVPTPEEREAFDAIVAALLGAGADPAEEDLSGASAASRAAHALNPAALGAFARTGRFGEGEAGPTLLAASLDPLAGAVVAGDGAGVEQGLATLRALFSAGCDPSAPLREGGGPVAHLFHQVQRALADRSRTLDAAGDALLAQVTEALLAAGADGRAQTRRGDAAHELATIHGWRATAKALPRAPRSARSSGGGGRTVLWLALLVLVFGAAGAAMWLLPRGWIQEMEHDPGRARLDVGGSDPQVATSAGGLCGDPAARPDASGLRSPWEGYRCASPRGMGITAEHCLVREAYTDDLGGGCPEEQLCCPPPRPLGAVQWWCLCEDQATLSGTRRTVTACFPTHEACAETEEAARDTDRLGQACQPLRRRRAHPSQELGTPELWRLSDGGESHVLLGSCNLAR